jgi:hypothetical protein
MRHNIQFILSVIKPMLGNLWYSFRVIYSNSNPQIISVLWLFVSYERHISSDSTQQDPSAFSHTILTSSKRDVFRSSNILSSAPHSD